MGHMAIGAYQDLSHLPSHELGTAIMEALAAVIHLFQAVCVTWPSIWTEAVASCEGLQGKVDEVLARVEEGRGTGHWQSYQPVLNAMGRLTARFERATASAQQEES